MTPSLQPTAAICLAITALLCWHGCASPDFNGYRGTPFHDSRYPGGPQKIPGRVLCAGKCVLTVHIVTQGNMNLAWFDFKPKGQFP